MISKLTTLIPVVYIQVFADNGTGRNCLRFNGGRNKTVEIPAKFQAAETSIYNGLVLKLIHADPSLNLIYINQQGESPAYYDADLIVENSQMASIALSLNKVKKLQYPYNDCFDEDHLEDQLLISLTKKVDTQQNRIK